MLHPPPVALGAGTGLLCLALAALAAAQARMAPVALFARVRCTSMLPVA